MCDSRCLSRSCARHPVHMKTGRSKQSTSLYSRRTKDFPTDEISAMWCIIASFINLQVGYNTHPVSSETDM